MLSARLALAFLATLCSAIGGQSSGLIVDASRRGKAIHPFIYGQFIEHLGRCINGGLWAEMLKDRKFFYEPGQPQSPWSVLGGSRVTLSSNAAFVNGHVPVVDVSGKAAGIFQGDVAVLKDMRYTGRIWLAAEQKPGPVEVRLVWGPGPGDRSQVLIKSLSANYRQYPLEFDVKADSPGACLEIVASGQGSLRVGPVSLMPADNIRGMRADVVALVKELNSPIYRWPGGTFATAYEWRDGLGDRDRRPTRENLAWGDLEPNDFGFHEFIAFCREVRAEPLVTVNTGFGDPHSAGEWVRYANDPAKTFSGARRAANGSREPFRVKYWCIGNEMWNVWSWGFMEVRYYVKKHNLTVDAMRAADPGIVTVASTRFGSMHLRQDTRKEVPWNDVVAEQCLGRMDFLGEHFYVGPRTNLLEHVAQAAEEIDRIGREFQALRQKYPLVGQSAVRLAMTEWNCYAPDIPNCGAMAADFRLRDGLLIAKGLHEYSRHSGLYFMANMAQTINVCGAIKTTQTATWIEPVGLAMILYRKHFGTVPVAISGEFAPLDTVAALTEDGNSLSIGVMNPTSEPREFRLDLKGLSLAAGGKRHWFGGGDDPLIGNGPLHPRRVFLHEDGVMDNSRLLVEPYSATVFVLPVKDGKSSVTK